MSLYVALGDSISIDEYTGVVGGGAASQLASRLGVELLDLTRDGNTTAGVRMDLLRMPAVADLVTITAEGNDLLLDEQADAIRGCLERIADHLDAVGARVIFKRCMTPATA